MNKIKISKTSEVSEFWVGDLFQCKEGNVYILSLVHYIEGGKCSNLFVAIDLSSGQFWIPAKKTIPEAINELTFLGRDLKIHIR